jgi:hypothetical protein
LRFPKNYEIKLKDKDIVEFFNFLGERLKEDLSGRYEKLIEIKKFLKYDILEKRIRLAESRAKNGENGEFPRVLEPWGEEWKDKCEIYKSESPYGHFPSY